MSNITIAGGAVDGVLYATTTVPYAATLSIDPTTGSTFSITGVNGALTLNATNVADGQVVNVVINTLGTTSNNVTFGTNFKSQGTLATGTVSAKIFVVTFVAVAGTLVETARTIAQ